KSMRERKMLLNRRQMLRRSALAMAALASAANLVALGAAPEKRFRIGVCDWSIGKAGDPAALEVAREIGLDGVQISPRTAEGLSLSQPEEQQRYRETAKQTGVQVASIGIAELNNVPYKSDARAAQWVSDSIDAAAALGVRVVLLAFFHKGDLRGDKPGLDEVVRRLKQVVGKAEKAGVILGLETWLSAREHLEILERVGSKSVQVYYDVCNSNDRGYDIYQEIRELGRERICEFHAKENGALLGRGKVDFQKVRAAMDAIDYRGWIQIEGAIPAGKPMLDAYKENCAFLRRIFS
ncbi:MAG TPA: sugar phosphate isomerase/epimerase family protein, partial [Clostridia bacterium]|nr:sugar phosphate isomerase/epimerase family protein [Clostridia bacterium]